LGLISALFRGFPLLVFLKFVGFGGAHFLFEAKSFAADYSGM